MNQDGRVHTKMLSESLCRSLVGDRFFAVESLARLGWRLFPCKSCDKTPLVKWRDAATSDLAVIRGWQQKYSGCNWAVACGLDSGVWVLDVDGPNGEASLDALCRNRGREWLRTLIALTARGHHVYFTYTQQSPVRNSAGRLGAGLDVRGDRGYVLVPPSIHPSGRRYCWHEPVLAIAAAPSWLYDLIGSQQPVQSSESEFSILREGQRNDGITRFAGSLRRKGKTQEQIECELLAANIRRCKPPLDNEEIVKIAASVARYPAGGPDPLERAWKAVPDGGSLYEQFKALARELQLARPGYAIALPLERIAALLGCHFNLISQFRKRAEQEGLLTLVERHVPHRKATTYIFNLDVEVGRVVKQPSSGLVTPGTSPYSYTPIGFPSSTPVTEFESKGGTDQ